MKTLLSFAFPTLLSSLAFAQQERATTDVPPPDTDSFWLWLILGIITLVVLVVAACVDGNGHPRKWLAKQMNLPMESNRK